MDRAQTIVAPSDGKPLAWDWLFLLVFCACVLGSAWVGVLAYREGQKTEATKRTGESWAQWFGAQAEGRSQEGYMPIACAARPGATWGACQAWLMGADGPMHGQRSAFDPGQSIRVLARCDPADRSGAGMVALEKLTPLPPGSAVPFIVSPLTERDPIDQRLTLRVTVCDKASGPIRIAEPEF